MEEKKGKKVLHLHFGVGPNLTYFLESTAYNNKHFRIPDNAGYRPRNQPITPDLTLETPLNTKFDMEKLREAVGKGGHET